MRPLEIEPARAKSKDPEKFWDHPEYILEEKFDGWRMLMHFGRDLERTYLTGRRTSKTTGQLSEKGMLLPELWIECGELGYTVLDGEVMPPEGAGFRDIASFLNADRETVKQAIAKHGCPTYHAFDLIYYDGVDIREQSMIERRTEMIKSVIPFLAPWRSEDGWTHIPHPQIKIVDQLPSKQEHYDAIVTRGGEGVILKNITSAYGESGGWIKVKKTSTLDVVVTGFTDAKFGRTGRIHGLIGAARVSVYSSAGELLEIGKVSGMTDDVRKHMTEHPEEWIGHVIEIEAAGFASERLWHPRFKRARPDADPRHATFEKMREDLGLKREEQVVKGEQRCLPL